MLRITHPPTYLPERIYIFDVLFRQFLGLEYVTEVELRSDVKISCENAPPDKVLLVKDVWFQQPEASWLQAASLPEQPLERWDATHSPIHSLLVRDHLPIIYGERLSNGSFIELGDSFIVLGIDIFASAFFMLTRYEEVVRTERDSHERFPATASLAYQEGFLDRPIVNEYLEILWWGLARLWPELQRKARAFQLVLSHDVDWPLGVAPRNLRQVGRALAGDVIKRRSFELAMRRVQSLVQVRQGNADADLNNTFDLIMTLSERHGLRSSFYFITDHPAGEIDGVYSLDDPWMRKLLRRIHERGHEIGLHPSYNTFRDASQLHRESLQLRKALAEEGIIQQEIGGRQHYLRWEGPTTWQIWDDAGLAYDSTLSFADHAGFRCGTCYEYSVFNLRTRRDLRLRERPLIVMEGSLLAEQYMNLPREQARQEIGKLKERCRQFQGDFTLLWHNSMLIHSRDAALYQSVVAQGNV